eukprot:TRINITY_DN4524_c0_g1_i2.p1 TRINITY_DN4524_c0_g1~~TRINITY_DN4524_c0_g1_i2.p1  ORF type:complete len:484 (+),score=50.46 TRINITY_DN4524_c0_g1_i2:64-1515(+)
MKQHPSGSPLAVFFAAILVSLIFFAAFLHNGEDERVRVRSSYFVVHGVRPQPSDRAITVPDEDEAQTLNRQPPSMSFVNQSVFINATHVSALLWPNASVTNALLRANLSRSIDYIIGVGVQKGGTSTLYTYLNAMSFTAKARGKELHFFDRLWYSTAFEQAKADYLQSFYPTAQQYMRMEVTPGYIYRREVPWLMTRTLGLEEMAKVRFIMLIRHPTKRVFSGVLQMHKQFKTDDLTAFIEPQLDREEACYDASFGMGPPSYNYSDPISRQQHTSYLVVNTSSRQVSRQYELPVDGQLQVLGECVDPVEVARRAYVCMHNFNTTSAREGIATLCHYPSLSNWTDELEPGCYNPKIIRSDIARSLYVDQLRAWLCSGIQPQQIMVLATSSWQAPATTLAQIAQWLGHEKDYMTNQLSTLIRQQVHQASNSKRTVYPENTARRMDRYFKPYNEALVELLEKAPFVGNDLGAIRTELGLTGDDDIR